MAKKKDMKELVLKFNETVTDKQITEAKHKRRLN